jgi:hypothetical protein
VNPGNQADTYAVDGLLRGLSVYDVAKLLEDTVETVEKHYGEFVKELRDRTRRLLDNGEGLENCTIITQQPCSEPEGPVKLLHIKVFSGG